MSQGKTSQCFPQPAQSNLFHARTLWPWPPTHELPGRLAREDSTGQALGTPRELTVGAVAIGTGQGGPDRKDNILIQP